MKNCSFCIILMLIVSMFFATSMVAQEYNGIDSYSNEKNGLSIEFTLGVTSFQSGYPGDLNSLGSNQDGLATFNGALLQIPNTIHLLTYEQMRGYSLRIFRTSFGVFGRYDLVQAEKVILRPHIGISVHADRYTLDPPLSGEESISLKTYYSISSRIGYDFGMSFQMKESSIDRISIFGRFSRDVYWEQSEWYIHFTHEKPYLPIDISLGFEYVGRKVNFIFIINPLFSYSRPGWLSGNTIEMSIGVVLNL
jgi:hypothetical protein